MIIEVCIVQAAWTYFLILPVKLKLTFQKPSEFSL